jgi:hypothetical protein
MSEHIAPDDSVESSGALFFQGENMAKPMARAKFYCTSIIKMTGMGYSSETGKYEPRIVDDYKFNAVSTGSEENKSFFASTPSGSLSLSSVRDDLFEVGKEYYLDFSPAEG